MATTSKTDILLPRDPTSSLQAVTKQYADAGDLDAARTFDYPLSEYGLVTSSIHIDCLTAGGASVSVNTIEVYRVYVPANKLITGACCLIKTAGSSAGTLTASGFALYTDDGSSRLAITANDYTIFTSTGWRSKAFTGTVAAQSTGRFLRVALIHTCVTVPTFFASEALGSVFFNGIVPSGTHRRGVFATSTTAFPSSFTASTFGSLDSPMLFIGLY